MTNKDCSKNEESGGLGVFGIAAIAAGVAAGFFLYGKDGAKNRKKVKGWTLKAKGEVLERLEKLKDINEDDYNKVIDAVSTKYSKMKSMDKEEVFALMDDMRTHWKRIEKKIEPQRKKAATAIKKGVSKAKKGVSKAKTKKITKAVKTKRSVAKKTVKKKPAAKKTKKVSRKVAKK